MVPQVDADGNGLAGVKMPESPSARHLTGWNLFNAFGSDDALEHAGLVHPAAENKRRAERTSDPRPSIEERYQTRERYLALVAAAARELAQQGYLLEADIDKVVERADAHWKLIFAEGEARVGSR